MNKKDNFMRKWTGETKWIPAGVSRMKSSATQREQFQGIVEIKYRKRIVLECGHCVEKYRLSRRKNGDIYVYCSECSSPKIVRCDLCGRTKNEDCQDGSIWVVLHSFSQKHLSCRLREIVNKPEGGNK